MITKHIIIVTVAIALLAPVLFVRAQNSRNRFRKTSRQSKQAEFANRLTKSNATLVKLTKEYRATLEKMLTFHESELSKVSQLEERHQELYQQGAISKRELEESELALLNEKLKLTNIRKQIVDADNLITEAETIENSAKLSLEFPGRYAITAGIIRYSGFSKWAIQDTVKIERFFIERFGRPLPISAFGQTAVHDRLGFNHYNAIDVAVSPDSAEGQALMSYLRNAGISFIAFRWAVPGNATGAHIHIGKPSSRI